MKHKMSDGHSPHKGHPHHKGHHAGGGMPYFENEHWQKKAGETDMADGKYTSGEMSNPEHLKKSVDALASYVKKHKEKH